MNIETAEEVLKRYFGYEAFRPMQKEVIETVYAKNDALVLMPTGGGKSLCFQIPSITMPGTAIVVSPLISLMKDQVEALKSNGVRAAFINSSLESNELRAIENQLYHGKLDLCYVSPEKATSSDFLPLLNQVKVNLIVVDEAHCISGWGHDFRPEYTKLSLLKKLHPNAPVMALTATADRTTKNDILKQLEIHNAEVFISSFDRPNLSLEVRPGRKRIEQILDYINPRSNEHGIIYCLSKKSCELVSDKLRQNGINADYYHAGLSAKQRDKVQEAFLNDNIQVVCATIAFGMGIDKSNVRYVIHYNLPRNIEAYYQEIGRAGRDGLPSSTLMFYSFGDIVTYRSMYERDDSAVKNLKLKKLDRVYRYATAMVCRRRILLNYFNEHLDQDCGNCDVCLNPSVMEDATVSAQKALSAIARSKENIGSLLLVNTLRGSKAKAIFDNGLHKIKTYGAGSNLSFEEWRYLIEQFINLGLIEVAIDQNSKLKLTPLSQSVLFDNQKVEVVSYKNFEENLKKIRNQKFSTFKDKKRDDLFNYLRGIRANIAKTEGIAPYMVFSDKTLEEISGERPSSLNEIKKIHGIGEKKLEFYGSIILEELVKYAKIKNIPLAVFYQKNRKSSEVILPIKSPKITTYMESFQLFDKGKEIEEIANERGLAPSTIVNHLIKMYEYGEKIDFTRILSKKELELIISKIDVWHENGKKLKPLYEVLEEKIEYHKLRAAIAYHNFELNKIKKITV